MNIDDLVGNIILAVWTLLSVPFGVVLGHRLRDRRLNETADRARQERLDRDLRVYMEQWEKEVGR